ncbi:MAG: hypothetical protein U9R60_02255 [Bacteroidota bacterium]|nr:hypothetical protein [Bacteroidota bacterium]
MKKQETCQVHSLFNHKYPIGIGVSDKLYVFQEQSGEYQYKATVTLPMEIQEGTKAAFSIDNLDDCCCIITPSCLEESNFYATILHEFVHCYQDRTCEQALKDQLGIYQRAFSSQDYMWEINHAFPYTHPDYIQFIQNISRLDYHEIQKTLSNLKSILEVDHYEYMIWQIWKEGFARFIENKILRMNGIVENNGGNELENINRTSLYFIGDRIWRQLELQNANLIEDIEKAFAVLKDNLV